MRRTKHMAILFSTVVLVFACCVLAACDPNVDHPSTISGNTDVVKAFNAVVPDGNVVTQTAKRTSDKYVVTVIAEDSAVEYVVGKDFEVEKSTDLLDKAHSATTAEELSPLETAYAKALELSGLAPQSVTGFDFDREKYMGKDVYKVEIEEIGAKYEYIFDAADFTLLDSEIEFETDLPTGSYIDEQTALSLALKAAGATAGDISTKVVRSEFEDGRKIFKASFDFRSYRYDVSVDAVSGDIVKFSKSALEADAPAFFEDITAESAKEIALAFVFKDGETRTEYTFRKVKLDREDGQFVYEVELLAKGAEYEFEISAEDGAILDVEIDSVKSQQSAPLPENRQFITREEAIAAVKKVAGEDIYILEVEIDKEGSKYFYEIEARVNGVKREYKVDALSGEILNAAAPSEAVISEEEAVSKALQIFQLASDAVDRQIVKLEFEDGVLRYIVKLYVGNIEYEAEIDATTGAVLEQDIDRDENHVAPPSTGTTTLTKEQAVAALKEYLGAQANVFVDKVEFEYENGKFVYEIEVVVDGREYDYYVDATTGAVAKNNEFVSGGTDIISEEQALDFAIKEFQLIGREKEISLRKIKLERDDFRLVYEVEFFIGNLKYEAEVDAATGAVIEKETSYD